ncbi:cupin domain-containing protein [Desulfohalovibrio reitneri]|uniref:cupin domain-containing protein n=1 Tax=Desulfohalovibrio reitneri TaxID=1307759 RepID=UPI0004A6C695|nr:cupin domain-containing protein [Desulfohalovibrio reitneri]
MKTLNFIEEGQYKDKGMGKLLIHDSPYFKMLNFNFEAGQELPVHAHDIEGQLAITVAEGGGEFLGADGATIPAKQGDVLTSDIAEPHGFRASERTRLLVFIAPPI